MSSHAAQADFDAMLALERDDDSVRVAPRRYIFCQHEILTSCCLSFLCFLFVYCFRCCRIIFFDAAFVSTIRMMRHVQKARLCHSTRRRWAVAQRRRSMTQAVHRRWATSMTTITTTTSTSTTMMTMNLAARMRPTMIIVDDEDVDVMMKLSTTMKCRTTKRG